MNTNIIIISDKTREKVNFDILTYPSGEFDCIIEPNKNNSIVFEKDYFSIVFDFTGNNAMQSFFYLPSVISALKTLNPLAVDLELFYLPFSRQDRSFYPGCSFGLESYAPLLAGCDSITVVDAHNESVLFNILSKYYPQDKIDLIQQFEVALGMINESFSQPLTIVSPDKGALAKSTLLVEALNEKYPLEPNEVPFQLLKMNKVRDSKTGKISHVEWLNTEAELNTIFTLPEMIIVDDICDGGATFIMIAQELKKVYTGKLHLYITHGFFTKGKEVLEPYFDSIMCYKDYS
jgi:ribose-phosphate pyrophosphokinase